MSVRGVHENQPVMNHKAYSNNEAQSSNYEKQNGQSNKPISKDELEKAVQKVNEFLKPVETSIQFELHEKLNEYYVKVINKETKEVLREIPPKKMLDMYAAMAELIGLIVNENV